MKDDRTQAIAARAHEIWERAGRPRGQHEAHWRQAEEEIAGSRPSDGAVAKPGSTEVAALSEADGGPAEALATTSRSGT